jgi:hypothetical protein
MSSGTILLLVRNPDQIGECLGSIDLLCRSKSNIQVVVLGTGSDSDWEDKVFPLGRLQTCGVECYTDTPAEAQSCGFHLLNKKGIAALLTRADVVIPL